MRAGGRPHHPAQHRVLRPTDRRGRRPRRRAAADLRRRVHAGSVGGELRTGQAARAWAQSRRGGTVGQHGRDAGRGDRAQQQGTCPEADEAVLAGDPHQRHHRDAQGRHPAHPTDAGPDRRCSLARAVQSRRSDVAAVADVPRARISARDDCDDAGLDAGPAPQVPSPHRHRGHRKVPCDSACRGAGDAVPHSGRARQSRPQLRPVVAAHRVRLRFSARRGVGDPGDEEARVR